MSSVEENDFVVIGKVTRPQGVRGEVRVMPLTMDNKRFSDLSEVYLAQEDCDTCDKRGIERVWYKKNLVVLKLSGCESYEAAEELRGCDVKVLEKDRITLSEDSFFWDDLVGMNVVSEDGEEIGRIFEIFPTGSNDVLVVKNKDREVLLPFIGEVVLDVNLEEKKMLVHMLDGLIS